MTQDIIKQAELSELQDRQQKANEAKDYRLAWVLSIKINRLQNEPTTIKRVHNKMP